jgi:cell division protein FtsN
VSSRNRERAEAVRAALAEQGIEVQLLDGGEGSSVKLEWLAPGGGQP